MSIDFDKVIQEIELLHTRIDKLEEKINAMEKVKNEMKVHCESCPIRDFCSSQSFATCPLLKLIEELIKK